MSATAEHSPQDLVGAAQQILEDVRAAREEPIASLMQFAGGGEVGFGSLLTAVELLGEAVAQICITRSATDPGPAQAEPQGDE